jgi:hypothetical protein
VLLEQLGRDSIADLDRLRLDRIQPAERVAVIHLAQLLAELTNEGQNPPLDLWGSCHPWLPEFSSFSPVRPTRRQITTSLLHHHPNQRKVQAAPRKCH